MSKMGDQMLKMQRQKGVKPEKDSLKDTTVPIFGLIEKDMDNPKALSDYKVMVKELTNKYLKGDK